MISESGCYDSEGVKLLRDTYEVYTPLSEKNEFCASKANYIRDGRPLTVYHYFVHVGKKEPLTEDDVKLPVITDEQITT